MEEKTLSLCYDPPVKYFMHHSIVLAMLLAENKNWNFVLSNYIQLNKSKMNKYLFDMYPRIGSGEKYGEYPLDNIMESHIISGNIMKISNRDIIDKVIEWINNGYYVTINSDERMLPDTAGYQSKIFHNHQGFYFGYDIVKCKMKMLNFDTKMNYRIIDVDFKNLIRSFESEELIKSLDEKGFDSYLIQLRKVKQDVIDYNYTDSNTIVYIQQYLYEYLNGINSSKKNLLSYEILKDNDWGVNVYETLFACLQGKYSNRFLFQGVCGLCEHKNLMLKRIHYLKERGYDIEEKTLTEYESVVKFFDKFKHIALKSILSNQYQLLNDYIKELKIIIALEKKVLERIVKSME